MVTVAVKVRIVCIVLEIAQDIHDRVSVVRIRRVHGRISAHDLFDLCELLSLGERPFSQDHVLSGVVTVEMRIVRLARDRMARIDPPPILREVIVRVHASCACDRLVEAAIVEMLVHDDDHLDAAQVHASHPAFVMRMSDPSASA